MKDDAVSTSASTSSVKSKTPRSERDLPPDICENKQDMSNGKAIEKWVREQIKNDKIPIRSVTDGDDEDELNDEAPLRAPTAQTPQMISIEELKAAQAGRIETKPGA